VAQRELEVEKELLEQLICNDIDIPPKSPFVKGGLGVASDLKLSCLARAAYRIAALLNENLK
jgi:hypothetical protein